MPITLIIFLALIFIARLFLGNLFPITADESYYWLWAKHLDLSYVDHPPMIAYINYLLTLGKENLLMLRLGTAVISLLVSIGLYFLTKEFFSKKVAFWSAVLFNLLPHFLIIWLTMFVELPLTLFWVFSLLILAQILKTRQKNWWYLLAITLGLGYLSKYTMVLFWPCLLIFFILSSENRFWLRQKELYLCFLISGLCFLPVIYWNSQHAWVSFTFHAGKSVGSAWGENSLAFVADQLVHFTPFLIFALYNVFKRHRNQSDATKLFYSFSAPVLLLFLAASLKVKIWAHWPTIGYITAIPLALDYLIENKKSYLKFMAWILGFSLIVLSILFWVSPGILVHQKEFASNHQLNDKLPRDLKIFAKTYASAALLEFYTKRQIYMASGFLKIGASWGEKQYELWGIPKLEMGESILYFGEDSRDFRVRADDYFKETVEIEGLKLNVIEDYIRNNYKFFILKGFKGLIAHP